MKEDDIREIKRILYLIYFTLVCISLSISAKGLQWLLK